MYMEFPHEVLQKVRDSASDAEARKVLNHYLWTRMDYLAKFFNR